jgi:tRNA pseudouridine(55) synthase
MKMPKIYSAVVKLGAETTTCDYTGDVIRTGDRSAVCEGDIDRALVSFLGWIQQVPPKVSAVHVKGRRAHELFRGGYDPDLKPKTVFIERALRTSAISPDGEFSIEVKCGKGAYIRALASDLGRALGCPSHIAALKRERVGYFSLTGSLGLGADFSVSREDVLSHILPVSSIDNFLPSYTVSGEDSSLMSNGVAVPLSRTARVTYGDLPPRDMAVITSESLLSVARIGQSGGIVSLIPEINIHIPNARDREDS